MIVKKYSQQINVFPKITYNLLLIQSLSSLCTLPTCSQGPSYLICDDPVSLHSLVSWVERQSRLVELEDALLSRQNTSRSAFPWVPTPTSQGALNILCGVLQRPLQVSRNQDWATSSHPQCTECLSMC